MAVALDKAYEDVHKVCGMAGRPPRKGMTVSEIEKAVHMSTRNPDSKFTWMTKHARPTFAQFANSNPTGRFIVVRKGHAVALIDGVWYDAVKSGCGARARVMSFCKVG
jgi:hypothetical protein